MDAVKEQFCDYTTVNLQKFMVTGNKWGFYIFQFVTSVVLFRALHSGLA
jgi:hypothetical protein